MKKTGVVIATIFGTLSCIVALFVVAISLFGLYAPTFFESIPPEDIPPNEVQNIEMLTEAIEQVRPELWLELRNGIIGFVTSVIVLITIRMKSSQRKYLFPSIAAGSAFIGAVFCGWMIMALMIGALIGIGLIMLSHYLDDKATLTTS
ncbi:MAG: hypothetical protein OXG88_00670 [Gammaproteobacteria bacterium]|nr:hypothetical protein [Gammaproteobacteria bacterium]